jgi:hypothetical protein
VKREEQGQPHIAIRRPARLFVPARLAGKSFSCAAMPAGVKWAAYNGGGIKRFDILKLSR